MGIRVEVESQTVRVRLGLVTRILAVKRRLEIPRDLVRSAVTMDRKVVPSGEGTWLRAPGTHIPGLIRYGSYGRGSHREFWAVLRQRRVLVVTVDGWDYTRVVLGMRDPDTAAAAISAGL